MDERVLAVQKMQDFIEKNLYKEITLLDLSRDSKFLDFFICLKKWRKSGESFFE